MKNLFFCMIIAVFLFISGGIFTKAVYAEEGASISMPLSYSYSSIYWWRGVELNGDQVGVLWPGIGLEFAGLSLSYAVGVSENQLRKENEPGDPQKDAAKSLMEMDYGLSYELELKPVTIGASVMYVQYHYYDEVDKTAIDPSFWEGGLSLGIDTILTPTVGFYYDYYVEETTVTDETTGEVKETPVDEDYYVKLSISQDLISTKEGFSFSVGAWVAYYNNAYLDRSGWSDVGGSLGISQEHGKFSFSGGMYYARTLSKDFKKAAGEIKNHFWCDFGIGYTL